jgi:hypothetical protein
MRLKKSNPLQAHIGPQGTTRLDSYPGFFSVTLTSPDKKTVISRTSVSHYRAKEIFADLAGIKEKKTAK